MQKRSYELISYCLYSHEMSHKRMELSRLFLHQGKYMLCISSAYLAIASMLKACHMNDSNVLLPIDFPFEGLLNCVGVKHLLDMDQELLIYSIEYLSIHYDSIFTSQPSEQHMLNLMTKIDILISSIESIYQDQFIYRVEV
ncbi:hypothetical protein [Paenibacillus sp. FSL H7-0331]|uniref:hypothetical protein n=1 Tax=Paenibacillus sp. FSL H7-0331 TaxID=1920421 RepID=UPI00096D2F8D|nr:hypothetical protein [Paenibacillus sp. FSL H7-0331]OMF07444.1 hypothetical protein BK127_29440 [Paenibacillus sp. FSL H7-0331]